MIGRLQTPCVWGETVVCESCHKALSEPAAQQAGASPPQAIPRKAGANVALLLLACALTLALSLLLSYLVAVKPLQDRLAKTRAELRQAEEAADRQEARLDALTKTVNHNAEAANRTAEGVDSLTRTVNHNAEAANRTSEDLTSLTQTVNHNADVANSNSRLR